MTLLLMETFLKLDLKDLLEYVNYNYELKCIEQNHQEYVNDKVNISKKDKNMSKINRLVSVAPMMDCTDRHERFFLRLISKNVLLYTEIVVSEAIDRDKENYYLLILRKPVALQLGGSTPKLIEILQKLKNLVMMK